MPTDMPEMLPRLVEVTATRGAHGTDRSNGSALRVELLNGFGQFLSDFLHRPLDLRLFFQIFGIEEDASVLQERTSAWAMSPSVVVDVVETPPPNPSAETLPPATRLPVLLAFPIVAPGLRPTRMCLPFTAFGGFDDFRYHLNRKHGRSPIINKARGGRPIESVQDGSQLGGLQPFVTKRRIGLDHRDAFVSIFSKVFMRAEIAKLLA